jgi:hypothetical protein
MYNIIVLMRWQKFRPVYIRSHGLPDSQAVKYQLEAEKGRSAKIRLVHMRQTNGERIAQGLLGKAGNPGTTVRGN